MVVLFRRNFSFLQNLPKKKSWLTFALRKLSPWAYDESSMEVVQNILTEIVQIEWKYGNLSEILQFPGIRQSSFNWICYLYFVEA